MHVKSTAVVECSLLCSPLTAIIMSLLDKLRKGAQKATIQATAFAQTSSSKVASGSRDFMQGFSLPGEAEKAAKILESFLGMYTSVLYFQTCITNCFHVSTLN